ncbi:hypothetical protein GCM10010218_31610 [Streptomyces mashuensis]|uniref:Uncharacterized protein n=1 Tax=Streptomyces mashuensis TaxID=33904 RepID=A0A919B3F8_9ACTN|nr:hypothetical protein [Streptomyces mashuensis]GHF47859.1 hypothetical protein GCM10010218_31610 [Streptomyces mashuensis]
MSFGDQNNPYGAPQGGAPGYAQQPYGAYPQAAPGGYPAAPYAPMTMPGITKAARTLLYVVAAIHVLIGGFCMWGLAKFTEATDKVEPGKVVTDANGNEVNVDKFIDAGKGGLAFFATLAIVFALLGILLAVRYGKGGNGVRVGTIVYASFAIISGLITVVLLGLGLLTLIMAILIIVFAAKQASAQWFRRPRH